MKRFIALTTGIIGLLLFAGCVDNTSPNSGNDNQPHTTPYITQAAAPTTQPTTGEPQPTQNIFTNALTEYFAGGVAAADNMMRDSTKAFTVDITGSGRPGVVAIRHFSEHFAQARIFYYVEGQLIYKDIPNIEGFPYSLAVNPERHLIIPAGDGGHNTWSWIHLDFSEDRLVLNYSPTIYRALNDDGSVSHYFSRGGRDEGFDGGFEPITEEEFNDIFQYHDLDNLTLWFDMPDETERILAMTF